MQMADANAPPQVHAFEEVFFIITCRGCYMHAYMHANKPACFVFSSLKVKVKKGRTGSLHKKEKREKKKKG